MNYRPDIDGLRTLAVVPVVLFHANVAGFTGGYVGVDIFFVISGFLITSIIHRELYEGKFSVIRFYERRARRILPALFAVTLSCLVVGWFMLAPDDYEKLGQSVLSALSFVSNMWFWQNSGGYFQGATDYLPMLHTWSLAVEEQFYIFFPLLLMLLHKIRRRLILPAILVLVLASLAVAVWSTPRMPSASFYLLPTRIWELGIGSLLALGLLPTNAPKIMREGFGALGIIAILVPVFLYDGSTMFPGLNALPPVLGAATLIWAGTAGPVAASRLLALRPMVWIGLISYSLYLWHWPIMAFVRNRLFMVELEPNWQGGTVLATFLAGWISWRFIERPFRVPVREQGLSRGRVFALSGIGITVLGALAGALILTDGMATQRFSSQQLAALKTIVLPSAERQKCTGARPIAKLCTFGEVNTETAPRWLLWGDSHAGAMLPALIELADIREKQLIFANKGNCPPLPGVRRSDMPPHESEKCEQFRQSLVDMILDDDRIESVFLVARWPLYGEGGQLPSEGGSSFRLVDTSAQSIKDDNFSVIRQNLERLSWQVAEKDKALVIIQSVPELPWNAVDRIEAELLFDISFDDDTVPFDYVLARQSATNKTLASVDALPNVTVVSVSDTLCVSGCPVRKGLSSYYRDNNHITKLGAILLTPILNRQVPVSAPE
ncbi:MULTISPECIES: acyltransferase family protein [Pseudomonadota]|uniref:acyltransferase family protein n=1 Tax=Pseudomonadota TaxID=1224 RepID=UPI003A95D8A3